MDSIKKGGKHWTTADDVLFTELWTQNKTSEEMLVHFPNRSAQSFIQKARNLGLSDQLRINGKKSSAWTDHEIERLKELWLLHNFEDIKSHFPERTVCAIIRMATRILNLGQNQNKIPKNKNRRSLWTKTEDNLLITLWPHYKHAKEIIHHFIDRAEGTLDTRAAYLGLTRTVEIQIARKKDRSDRQAIFNKTVLGRDLSYENVKEWAKQYSTRSEFILKDGCSYGKARHMGWLDEICSHMITNITTSRPQLMLYELVKLLYPENAVKFNDRKAIYPKEIDVYIPELKLGFEYDGAEYHSNPEVDKMKDDLCASLGIKLIRIKERSKSKPMIGIVDQMSKFYVIDEAMIESVKEKVINSFVSKADLENTCAQYTDYATFMKAEKQTARLLTKNGLFVEMTKHMYKKVAPTYEEIEAAILNATCKGDIHLNSRFYRPLTKYSHLYPNLVVLYKTLPDGRSSKN